MIPQSPVTPATIVRAGAGDDAVLAGPGRDVVLGGDLLDARPHGLGGADHRAPAA
jgi:hypothetical protein